MAQQAPSAPLPHVEDDLSYSHAGSAHPPQNLYPVINTTIPSAQSMMAPATTPAGHPMYAQPPPHPAYAQPPPHAAYAQSPPHPVYAQPPPHPGAVAPMSAPLPVGYDEKHALQMGNFIFLGTYGKIRALEIINGKDVRTVWNEELKGCGHHMVHIKLFIARGLLYAATNGHVFCFEALTGKTIWKQKPDLQHGVFASTLVTLLLTYDGSILVTASNGSLVAFNALTGQIIWQQTLGHWFSSSYDAYALLEHNGLLYVGNEGYVYSFFMVNGQIKWQNSLQGFGFGPISLAAYIFAPPTGGVYDILFVGTYGYILALDGQNGHTRHHINLDGTGYKPVALLLDPQQDALFTATSGELRCFRANSMAQIWKSDLKGMSYSFGHSILLSDVNTIVIGMHGKVAGIHKANGNMEWSSSLPGCGFHFVTVISTANPNWLICGSSGKLYGIDKKGHVLWKDGLSGMGYESTTISTTVHNTDFNSTTLPQNIEMLRRQQRNNGGGAGAIIALNT